MTVSEGTKKSEIISPNPPCVNYSFFLSLPVLSSITADRMWIFTILVKGLSVEVHERITSYSTELERTIQSATCLFPSEAGPNTTLALMPNNVCCAVSLLLREPLGASSDPAGSESLPALLHHCITKAKGVAANNNNNTTSGRRTGLSDGWRGDSSQSVWAVCYSCATLCLPFRCVSLSDPAATSDTPRGTGSPQQEEKAKQEEPLYLFNLLPAPQAVWGGPDRHTGQCGLRGPKLRDSSLTRGHNKPLDSTRPTPPQPSLLHPGL